LALANRRGPAAVRAVTLPLSVAQLLDEWSAMAAAKRSTKKKAPVLPENATPSETLAATIVAEHVDLTPSVGRIMNAELGEAGQLQALTLFYNSIGVVGDTHRNPANAIEAGRTFEAAVG
jgi:hypothetical protein